MRAPKPQLNNIHPHSVLRIFNVIEKFVPIGRKFKSVKDLRKIFNGSEYTIEEKYFISFYLEQYLSLNDAKSIFSLKIKEIKDLGDSKDLEDSVIEIENYSNTILAQTSLYSRKYLRVYRHSLKSEKSIKDNLKNYEKNLAWERLPLFKDEKIDFLNSVRFELKDLLLTTEIENIIKNSFELDAIPERIEFLNLEIDKSADVHKAIYNIYLKYKKYHLDFDIIQDKHKKRISANAELIKGTNFTRADFITRKEYARVTNKVNFAKIMFMTFSKVRENFEIDCEKKNKRDLNSYLITFSRNIKK